MYFYFVVVVFVSLSPSKRLGVCGCHRASDPMEGNWPRYANWAHSTKEKNLFPLEINQAIDYNMLRVGLQST